MRTCSKFGVLLLALLIFFPIHAMGQEGVGLPFLKIGIGARQAGMGNVFTGVGDDIYTLYWNPGGLGHIRRWQWTAAYNRWFTDVYQASMALVKQFRILGSHKTALGLSASYVGMPSWDSTEGERPSVSADHFVAGVSLGQRLDWLSPSLSVGVTVKGIASRLDAFSAKGVAADAGLLFRPHRFALGSIGMGIFEYGVFTYGVSLLHLGPKMKFDTEYTSLPQTWRTGISLKMGKYGGWSLLLASDIIGVKDRDVEVGVGGEIWWKDFLGARLGYRFNGEDLGDLTFGLGLRWDNVINSLLGLPTRYGDAFEVNLADVGYGEVLHETYRGALSHYPVAPEPFLLKEPRVIASKVLGESSLVRLNWEEAKDPDAFDEVSYMIVIDKDEDKIERSIKEVEKDFNAFLISSLKDSLLVCESIPSTVYATSVMEGGIYYWAVFAYDLDRHVQLAVRGEEHVAQFVIPTQDLAVKDFSFTPTQWITTTPEQGILTFVVSNEGVAPAKMTRFVVQDVFIEAMNYEESPRNLLLDIEITLLEAKQDTTIFIPWFTEYPGLHSIEAVVYPDSVLFDQQQENNYLHQMVVSVPKGQLIIPDSVEVMATGYDSTEIPVVPEIYFNPHEREIASEYYTTENVLPSVLITLAERMKENPEVTLTVMGSIDRLSGEQDPILADERAENVKRRLESLGTPSGRVIIVNDHPNKILGRRRRPADPQDAEWMMEQNRVVTFQVPQEDEEKIFKPHRVAVDTILWNGIPFGLRVITPGGVSAWNLSGDPRSIELSREEFVLEDRLQGDFEWKGTDQNESPVPRDRWYRFTLSLTDTLGRSFRTRPDSLYLQEKRTIRRREVFGAAKFAQVEPVYQFYWKRMMDIAQELAQDPSLRVRFEGHACAIGPEGVNERLSYRRAQRFNQAFMNRLKNAYPVYYKEVWKRIESPVGFGEKESLEVKLKGRGKILLGDNNAPVGRYLNRRIMVLLYREN